jgi:hypothetical protein
MKILALLLTLASVAVGYEGSAMKRKSKLTIAVATAVLAVATAVYAQDKYSLKSPSGIAFSDFRGYENRAVVSWRKLGRRSQCARWKRVVALELAAAELVSREAVKLLVQVEGEGIELRSCPAYIREWVTNERESS